jgi:hypothetical protein
MLPHFVQLDFFVNQKVTKKSNFVIIDKIIIFLQGKTHTHVCVCVNWVSLKWL